MILRLILALVIFVAYGCGALSASGLGVAATRDDKTLANKSVFFFMFSTAFLILGLVGLVHG